MLENKIKPVEVKSKAGSGKRSRYWSRHEKPKSKIATLPGRQSRLRKGSIWFRVMGLDADRPLVQVYGERLNVVVGRLLRVNPWKALPPRIEELGLRSAGLALDGRKNR